MLTKMIAIEASTITLTGDEPLGSASGVRPMVVNRTLSSFGERHPEEVTIQTYPRINTAGEVERRGRRVPSLMPKPTLSQDNFVLLEKWDGVVIGTDAETFAARLYRAEDKTHTIQAVFSKNELKSEERGQIEEGAAFVWTLGYRDIGATRHRDSVIYFRRLPAWDNHEIETAGRRGVELTNVIGWK